MSARAGNTLDWRAAKQGLRDLFREPPVIVFGTGPSCAVDRRFGMGELADHLRGVLPGRLVTGTQRADWQAVEGELANGRDLEAALTQNLDDSTVELITQETAAFVGSLDDEYAGKLAKGDAAWPLAALFRKLLGTYPNAPELHAITPNYDLLMEYSCDAAGIEYATGFVGGVSRRLDWARATGAMLDRASRLVGKRRRPGWVQRPHVRLHKVH